MENQLELPRRDFLLEFFSFTAKWFNLWIGVRSAIRSRGIASTYAIGAHHYSVKALDRIHRHDAITLVDVGRCHAKLLCRSRDRRRTALTDYGH